MITVEEIAQDAHAAISVADIFKDALAGIAHVTKDQVVLEIIRAAFKDATVVLDVREVIVMAEKVIGEGQ
jgi:hypothetical protein